MIIQLVALAYDLCVTSPMLSIRAFVSLSPEVLSNSARDLWALNGMSLAKLPDSSPDEKHGPNMYPNDVNVVPSLRATHIIVY